MSYPQARNRETRAALRRRIEEFVSSYKKRQDTIVFLPGGMGSQIDRSTKPYKSDASLPFQYYDPIWMDMGIIFGEDVKLLEIKSNGHDVGNHICVPNGPLRFLVNPYDYTRRFFNEKGYNYTVFGYDWRRPLRESAGYLHYFLRQIRDRVLALRNEDPLPRTTILCHSMGGLVAKVFFHRVFKPNTGHDDVNQWMARFITVATPFLGTATHMRRYYVGQEPLSTLHGAREMARISGTLPGPYILLFLDPKTYDHYESDLECERYPMRDAESGDKANPYEGQNFIDRYPSWVEPEYLKEAMNIRRTIVKPLPDPVAEHVFHIRARKKKTFVELSWAPVDGSNFDPATDKAPLSGIYGEGDETVPWWSAKLPQIPLEQVYDLKIAKNHGELMEHDETLKVVLRIIKENKVPKTVTAKDVYLGEPVATLNSVNRFIKDVANNKITMDHNRASDKKIWRGIMKEASLC